MRRVLFVLVILSGLLSYSQAGNYSDIESSNDELSQSSLIVEETVNLQEYIVLRYNGISNDLIAGDGPHLRALLQIVNIKDYNVTDEVKRIRILLRNSLSIFEFSDALISYYQPVE